MFVDSFFIYIWLRLENKWYWLHQISDTRLIPDFSFSTPKATTAFVTKLAIGRQVSAILPGAVFWWIRKQRGYLSDNVGSEVRWRTRLRFYGADKKLISERGSCSVVCLLGENRLTQKGMPRISPRKHPSYLFISWSTSPTVGLACIHVTYGPEHPESMSTTPFVSYPLLWTARYRWS